MMGFLFDIVKRCKEFREKQIEEAERCGRRACKWTVGNHPPCEECVDGSEFQDDSEVFCATYNEKCLFGGNCNYCREVRGKE